MPDLLIALGALAVLTVSASQFVLGAARVATALRMSQLFIGAVLLGAGTSLPDGLVSGFAAAGGDPGIALGNVFGSNAFNVAVALGVGAIITPLAISRSVLRREAVLSTMAVLTVLGLAIIGLTKPIGVLLVLLVIPALWLMALVPDDRPEEAKTGGDVGRGLPIELARSLAGLALTVLASRLLVESAEATALDFGVSEAAIGLTLVAVGTSLPELFVSIQAARQGATDMVIGNVLGSNLLNSLGVAGAATLLSPATIETDGLLGAGILMAALTLAAVGLLATGRKLVRWEGAALLGAYVVLLPILA